MSNYNQNRCAQAPGAMNNPAAPYEMQRAQQMAAMRRAQPSSRQQGAMQRPGSQQPQPAQSPCCQRPSPPQQQADSCQNDEAYQKEMRELQMDNLVKDSYCPGAMQDTIDGEENFNRLAFELVFGNSPVPETIPQIQPMSLLEAFQTRLDLERCDSTSGTPEDDKKSDAEPSTAALILQVEDAFKCKYRTDLNEALKSYIKAEIVHNVEEPVNPNPTFKIEMSKGEMVLPNKPILLKQYCGITRPT